MRDAINSLDLSIKLKIFDFGDPRSFVACIWKTNWVLVYPQNQARVSETKFNNFTGSVEPFGNLVYLNPVTGDVVIEVTYMV